jgi:hypothetical protein
MRLALCCAACFVVAWPFRRANLPWMIDISWVSPQVDPCVTYYGQELLCLDTEGPGLLPSVRFYGMGALACIMGVPGKTHAGQGGTALLGG